jgi:hypothetical protein
MYVMSESQRRGTALILVAALALPGCATSTDPGGYRPASVPLTPAERRLRRQTADLARTNTQACVAGGALGGLSMLLLSRNRRDAGQRALVGALAGCAAGMGLNTYVQGERRQYAFEEERLRSMLADVRADNDRVARLIDTTEEVIAADKRRIADAERSYAAKQTSLAQARRELRAVRDNRVHLKRTHAALRDRHQEWARISSYERRLGSDTRALDAEIERLKEQISGLEEELMLIDQRIRVSPISA